MAANGNLSVLVFLVAVAVAAGAGPAAPSLGKPGTLDHKAIHERYNDGDFDEVLAVLEDYVGRNRTWSHEDSVFIAKHLAVVYTANPATREKGKYYMHRLLELLPSAKLVDMYVSEEIERIFEKIREEYQTRQRPSREDVSRTAAAEAAPADPRKSNLATVEPSASRKRGHAGFWIAGGAAAAAAGLTVVYFVHQAEKPADSNFRVPRR
jgi:hypothetical protein